VNQRFGLKHLLILTILMAIILAPRPLAGAAYLESARCSSQAGDFAAVSSALAAAAPRLPWDASLFGMAGQAFRLAGDPEQAIHWFAGGADRHALSLTDWLAYGDTFAVLGDVPSALWAWKQSILLHGTSLGAASRLATASRQAGDLANAIGYLTDIILLAPDDAGTHYKLGLLLTATAPEKALPELMKAAALDPELEDPVQALRLEINLAFLVDDRAYQFTICGRALALQGDWDLAAEAFRRAIGEDEEYAVAWAWLGEARQQTGADGRPQLDRALSLDPRSASIQAFDGMYWMRQGDPEKALTSFEKAAAIEPENPVWQVSLGNAASASGDLLAASQYFHRAVELGPDDPAAWRALALFSLENETDVENSGLTAARQLLRLAPDDWLTYDIVGQVATQLVVRVEAIAQLQKAIALAPQEPAPHYHLALAYLESGKNALAYDKLLDTLALDPDGTYGWHAKRILEQYFP
jgi:tetratricopeptide (TPR) repeat protein